MPAAASGWARMLAVIVPCLGAGGALAAPVPNEAGPIPTAPSVLLPPVQPLHPPVALPSPAVVMIPVPPSPPLAADPGLTPAAVGAAAAQLRASLAAEVPHLVPQTPESSLRWVVLARAQLAAAHAEILRPQLIVVVDRATRVQELALLVAQPDGPFAVIGAVHVSTGQAGRFDHYVTPTGVYRHTDAILDYRAAGNL